MDARSTLRLREWDDVGATCGGWAEGRHGGGDGRQRRRRKGGRRSSGGSTTCAGAAEVETGGRGQKDGRRGSGAALREEVLRLPTGLHQ